MAGSRRSRSSSRGCPPPGRPSCSRTRGPGRKPGAHLRAVAWMANGSLIAARGRPVVPVWRASPVGDGIGPGRPASTSTDRVQDPTSAGVVGRSPGTHARDRRRRRGHGAGPARARRRSSPAASFVQEQRKSSAHSCSRGLVTAQVRRSGPPQVDAARSTSSPPVKAVTPLRSVNAAPSGEEQGRARPSSPSRPSLHVNAAPAGSASAPIAACCCTPCSRRSSRRAGRHPAPADRRDRSSGRGTDAEGGRSRGTTSRSAPRAPPISRLLRLRHSGRS